MMPTPTSPPWVSSKVGDGSKFSDCEESVVTLTPQTVMRASTIMAKTNPRKG
jgi:hypothetical protein